MRRLHITQDDHGFWMLSLEEANREVTLLAHQMIRPERLVRQAMELVFGGSERAGRFPDGQIIIDPPRGMVPEDPELWPADYQTPAGRKTSE